MNKIKPNVKRFLLLLQDMSALLSITLEFKDDRFSTIEETRDLIYHIYLPVSLFEGSFVTVFKKELSDTYTNNTLY